MYTRHTGLNIPKNYSGSRFSRADDPLPVKEHRPTYNEAVRSAHSPSYDEEISKVEDTAPLIVKDENTNTEAPLCVECEKKNDTPIPFSLPINEILSAVDKEELLLIGIILLIASERNSDNNLILTLLSLLLLYK